MSMEIFFSRSLKIVTCLRKSSSHNACISYHSVSAWVLLARIDALLVEAGCNKECEELLPLRPSIDILLPNLFGD